MFKLKQDGKLLSSRRFRRKSTLSLIREKVAKKKNKLLQSVEEGKNLMIIQYKEFTMIKFTGRPQIFLDFLQYTCDFDFLKEKGLKSNTPMHSNNNSETIVVQMNLNHEFHEKIRKNDKYDYYCELDTAMSQYDKSDMEDLLKKFNFLESDDGLKYKVITKESMIKKFVLYK